MPTAPYALVVFFACSMLAVSAPNIPATRNRASRSHAGLVPAGLVPLSPVPFYATPAPHLTTPNTQHTHTRIRSLRPLLLLLHAYWTLARNGLYSAFLSSTFRRPSPSPTLSRFWFPSPFPCTLPFLGSAYTYYQCSYIATATHSLLRAACIGIVFHNNTAVCVKSCRTLQLLRRLRVVSHKLVLS